jgi:hypothetical protein
MLVTTASLGDPLYGLGRRWVHESPITSHENLLMSSSGCPSVGHCPDRLFDLGDIHHYDCIPGAAIQKAPVRTLAYAFLASYAEHRINLDAAKRRMVLIRHPKHAIFHRAIFHACRRSRATRAAFGNHSKFFRFFLASSCDPLGTRLMLQRVGDHPCGSRSLDVASHVPDYTLAVRILYRIRNNDRADELSQAGSFRITPAGDKDSALCLFRSRYLCAALS